MSSPAVEVAHRAPIAAPPAVPLKGFPTLVRPKTGRPLLLAELRQRPRAPARRDPPVRHLVVDLRCCARSCRGRSPRPAASPSSASGPSRCSWCRSLGVAFYFGYKANSKFKLAHAWPVLLYSAMAVVALFPPLGGRAGLGSLFRAVRFLLTLVLLLQLVPIFAHDRYIPLRGHFAIMKIVVVVQPRQPGASGKGFDDEGRLITQLPAFTAPGLAQWTALFSVMLVFLLLQPGHPAPQRHGLAGGVHGVPAPQPLAHPAGGRWRRLRGRSCSPCSCPASGPGGS